MSPSGSFASVDPGRSSSNTVQPLSYTGPDMFFYEQDLCLLSIRGPEAAHCLVGDAGIPSKLVGYVYQKLLVSVLPISENRLANVDLYDAPVLWATEANSCLDETGR